MKGKIVSLLIIDLLILGGIGIFQTNSGAQLNYDQPQLEPINQVTENMEKYAKGDLSVSDHDHAMDESFLGNPLLNFNWKNYNDKDWTAPVKSQGHCGSCWAFADIGVVDSLLNILSLDPNLDKDLSEQYLVSCCTISYCNGCQGAALVPPAGFANFIDWTVDHEVVAESCFPYQAIDSNGCDADDCDHNPVACIPDCPKIANVLRWGWVSADGSSIKNALLTMGPLIAHMKAYDDFDGYQGGVYYHGANGEYVDHLVVIVGYDDSQSCWVCKNSWGTSWGEGGYFRIQYGCCDIEQNVAWMEVDYGSPTESMSGNQRYQADSGWHVEGIGMHCDNTWGSSDQRVYYKFIVPKNTADPVVIGTEFWSQSIWPNLNGPDLEVYYPSTGSWVKIKSSLGNNDALLWKRYMVLNDYISSSNELKFRLMCAAGDNVYINEVSVKYTEPEPPAPVPDLDCGGQISRTNVKPGAKVTGSFTVKNVGEANSLLAWKVDSYPNWGTSWSFSPSSGSNLKPSDGGITVSVSFNAPNEKYQDFGGKIKVINIKTPSDYDEIPLAVVTPRLRSDFKLIFNNFIERFPLIDFLLNFNFRRGL